MNERETKKVMAILERQQELMVMSFDYWSKQQTLIENILDYIKEATKIIKDIQK